MMIDSVVWAQYINVTDIQTDRQTDGQTATSPKQMPRQRTASPAKPVLFQQSDCYYRTSDSTSYAICFHCAAAARAAVTKLSQAVSFFRFL